MRRCFPAILLLSVIVPSAPRLIEKIRTAFSMLPLTWEQRQEAIPPGFYANIEELRRRIPPTETFAMIGTSRPSLDQAVFVNYYLYPRRTRIYRDRWMYLTADPKSRPAIIVRPADARITSYAEVRNEELGGVRVVRNLALPAAGRKRFLIPIASSSDGPPPVSYTVEGVLAGGEEAQVTLTLWPAKIVKTLTIRGTRAFTDLVYECFGVMEFAAWIEVDSDRPLRAAFWLVNRAARTAAPIRLIEGPLRAPAALPALPPPAILWLLNPSDSYAMAHAGTHPALVPPRSLLTINATGTVRGPVYAFISEKMPDGQTRFTWP